MREQLARDLCTIAEWFRMRMDGASRESRNRYFLFAEVAEKAAGTLRSDEETIREYEEYVDGMEDNGK